MSNTLFPSSALRWSHLNNFPAEILHTVTHQPVQPPYPETMQQAIFGMGCFWGAEKLFWQQNGIFITAVGYGAGHTTHPSYRDVCSGQTGHNELVLVIYEPNRIDYPALLKLFWEGHDPTQGMRQGNDRGTQYRSMIQYSTPEQQQLALESKMQYQQCLTKQGYPDITTEIIAVQPFYYAEVDHQQYLAKNPHGYCGLGGTGITY